MLNSSSMIISSDRFLTSPINREGDAFQTVELFLRAKKLFGGTIY